MFYKTRAERFLRSESGAVTVDWIVLSSVVIGVGVVVASMVGGGTQSLTSRINEQLATAQPDGGSAATVIDRGN
jgi:Flp pilus assembly pilin Flp